MLDKCRLVVCKTLSVSGQVRRILSQSGGQDHSPNNWSLAIRECQLPASVRRLNDCAARKNFSSYDMHDCGNCRFRYEVKIALNHSAEPAICRLNCITGARTHASNGAGSTQIFLAERQISPLALVSDRIQRWSLSRSNPPSQGCFGRCK